MCSLQWACTSFNWRGKHSSSQDVQSLHLQKDGTPKFWAKGPALEFLSFYGYQKSRAGISLHHLDSTLCQQLSQTEGPSSSLLYCLVLYTGTSLHAQQKGKQVPALFRWQTDNACPSSKGAIVLLCALHLPFQAALISPCPGQACVWIGVFKPITQREDVDLLWEGRTPVLKSRRE